MSAPAPEIDPTEMNQLLKEFDTIQEKLEDENRLLWVKYELKKVPLYERRREVVARLPQFWTTALENHNVLGEKIDESEEELFAELKDIWVDRDAKDPRKSKLTLTFDENPIINEREVSIAVEGDLDDGKFKKTVSKVTYKKDLNAESLFHTLLSEDAKVEHLLIILINDLFPEALVYYAGKDEEYEEDMDLGDMVSEEEEEQDDEEEEEQDDEEEEPHEYENANIKKMKMTK